LGSKLNGTLMSFVWVRVVAGAACRRFSFEAAEARGQPRPKKMENIASAVTARSARGWSATEDRSLVILVVLPSGLHQPGIPPWDSWPQ
jgi:hypothetical protein